MYRIELNTDTEARQILATNEEFYHPDMIGPGHDLGAKVWKTKAGAEKYAQRRWGRQGWVRITKEGAR